ncbi:hypothetical protein N1030_10265 [Desulfovibrio mangrovi]|uniref:hypothetical protein n=1 Tax=Desulfovibrio mangrovi TaxID=2976983 RepID=UPI0022485FBC|nr:hypothetical protein [Desulfovibrio mangrovi]UZP66008.1 hypothetical protein N1030_10265 [Desulfovibrio mangrovi]
MYLFNEINKHKEKTMKNVEEMEMNREYAEHMFETDLDLYFKEYNFVYDGYEEVLESFAEQAAEIIGCSVEELQLASSRYGLIMDEVAEPDQDEAIKELAKELRKGRPNRMLNASEVERVNMATADLDEIKATLADWESVVVAEKCRLNGTLLFKSEKEAAAIVMCLHEAGWSDRPLFSRALEAFLALAPREVKDRMFEKALECFPGLTPSHHDADGNFYFNADSVKEELGVTDADVAECAEEQADSCRTMTALSGTVH